MKHPASSLVLVLVVLLTACATPIAKPAFYPNAHYQRVGTAQAQADAQACATLAQQSEASAVSKADAGRAAVAGAAGVGAAGMVGSLLSGHKPDLKNMAAGAAALGTAGAAATAAGQSFSGSPIYRQFVQQCLTERGYHVLGWQ